MKKQLWQYLYFLTFIFYSNLLTGDSAIESAEFNLCRCQCQCQASDGLDNEHVNQSRAIRKIERRASHRTIILEQSDFEGGTYRIKKGGTYKLGSNIIFDPIPSLERPDKPATGWFAVITVETDEDVVIDLKQFSIEASQKFVDQHFFNVFAHIELDNSPVAGKIFGLFGANFKGDTEFVSASNVVVKNGSLGRSSHWGIHGNNNNNIHLRDLTIADWEVAGIEINSLWNGSMKNIDISGLEHQIFLRSILLAALVTGQQLEALAQQNYPGAAAQLQKLEAFIAANPETFFSPISLQEGSAFYGIIMASGFTNGIPFPLTSEGCKLAALTTNGRQNKRIELENINIHDLASKPVEVVNIGSNIPGPTGSNFIDVKGFGLFGVLRYQDAFNSTGTFAPNDFLQSQLFVANAKLALNPALANACPANLPDIIDSILTPNEAKFLSNIQPLFGIDNNGDPIKGIFGFRIDCSEGVSLKNCKAKDISNIGEPGLETSDLPDGAFFSNLVQTQYNGNAAWGYAFAVDHNLTLKDCQTSKIKSINGDAFGIDLINEISQGKVTSCSSKKISGFGDNTSSVVNLPSETYGFRAINNTGSVVFKKCSTRSIKSPRAAFGFGLEQTNQAKCLFCKAKDIEAFSPSDLYGSVAKAAYGFLIEGTSQTLIKSSKATNAHISGEENSQTQTQSIAAGFVFNEDDSHSKIKLSRASNNLSGGGTAVGVFIDGAVKTKIISNTIERNIAEQSFAEGFGIKDTATHSSAILRHNRVRNNSTQNIDVNN